MTAEPRASSLIRPSATANLCLDSTFERVSSGYKYGTQNIRPRTRRLLLTKTPTPFRRLKDNAEWNRRATRAVSSLTLPRTLALAAAVLCRCFRRGPACFRISVISPRPNQPSLNLPDQDKTTWCIANGNLHPPLRDLCASRLYQIRGSEGSEDQRRQDV